MYRLGFLRLSTPLMLLTLAMPAFPQEEKPEPAKKSKTMTLTGCLNKGERENHYSFTDKKDGTAMNVTGAADLAKHAANHTVKITGYRTGEVFNVTKVEHVSPTCDATATK
jgi:hypothetical protein